MLSRSQLSKLAEALAGIPVWGALPGSLSHRAGVRYGDIVLEVNGQPTATIDDYLEARSLRADGAEVVIFRDGSRLTLQLEFEGHASSSDPQALRELSTQLAEARLLPGAPPGPAPNKTPKQPS